MAAEIYEKIVRYIDGNIKESMTLVELSKVAGYSQAQIYRLFKIYTPVPVMEYIRRKRLYYAANELYTGRNLYDVALDYGYETPAGFYKAFKSVFGCAPSRYKNNKSKSSAEGKKSSAEGKRRNIFMNIENVKSVEELNEVFKILKSTYPAQIDFEGDGLYSRKFWIEQFEKNPELLLYAKDGDKICGVVLGWADGGSVTIGGDLAAEEYKNKGIHEALFIEMEKRAEKHGFDGVVLGIEEGKEEFYAKLGYTGNMLVQSEKYSAEDLSKHLEAISKASGKEYEIIGTGVYDGYINQIWLRVSILDKEVKKAYEETLGDCWTQIIVSKKLNQVK